MTPDQQNIENTEIVLSEEDLVQIAGGASTEIVQQFNTPPEPAA